MLIRTLETARRERRGGQNSFLLLSSDDAEEASMSVTWVEGDPDSEQEGHAHPASQQVYVVTEGRGLMRVGDEEAAVGPGTMILIPPGSTHSIRNVGDAPLRYVSATVPPFEVPPGRWT